jgi:alpha-D-ribose 1-methylphosphonate 5-triphosphate synthase subunit PhnG
MIDTSERAQLLAAAPRAELLDLADRCLAETPDPEILAGPEVGTVVLNVREPVESIRFQLGDVLTTRCEVRHRQAQGWAMRLGDDRPGALAAAVCDAEYSADGPHADEVARLCTKTAASMARERALEWSELEPTIVAFEELDL